MEQSPSAPECHRHPGREAHIRCQRCERPICPDCMVPAAVGFQCPSCVKDGAAATRQGRAAYGGQRSGDPTLTSRLLIALNVAVWIAITVTGAASSRLVDLLALRPDGLCGFGNEGYDISRATCSAEQGTWLPGVVDGAWWQLVTSMFTHVDVVHIGFNMLALWVLGPQLEAALGRVRFLAVYLLSGLGGSALVYLLASQYSATLGASGAVFGLMGALLVLALKVRGDVQSLLVWIGINAVITVIGRGAISWQGHLGGFLGGLALMAIIAWAPRSGRERWQALGMAAYAVVLVVVIALRTTALA